MIYEGNSQWKKNIDIEETPIVIFQTKLVTVKLIDEHGNPLDDGIVKYRAKGFWKFFGWRTFGTTMGGEVSKELLPGRYSFRMIYEDCTYQTNNIDISKISVITFQIGKVHKCCGKGWKYHVKIWNGHRYYRWKCKRICNGCW